MKTIEISDHAYNILKEQALLQGKTPDYLVEELIFEKERINKIVDSLFPIS